MPLGDTATIPGDALPSPKLSPLLSLSSTVSGMAIGTVAALASRSLTGEGPVEGGGIETCTRQRKDCSGVKWGAYTDVLKALSAYPKQCSHKGPVGHIQPGDWPWPREWLLGGRKQMPTDGA